MSRQVSLGGATVADRTFAYDLLGRQTNAAFVGGGWAISRGFDALGRMTSETQGGVGTVSYQHDLADRTTRITWPDAFYVAYDWTLDNQLLAVRENGATSGVGVLATYAYDDLGRTASVYRGNGTTTSYGYDGVSRLTSLAHDFAGGAHDVAWTFAHNPAGQITTQTRDNDAFAWTDGSDGQIAYVNDGKNRVTQAGAEAVAYDAGQNITGVGSGAVYAFNALNELTASTVGGVSRGYAYDPAGRLIGAEGRELLYGGTRLLSESAGGGVVARYVPGQGADQWIAVYSDAAASSRRWTYADHLGSIVAQADATGALQAANAYDEYGVPKSTNTGRLGYTGQLWLPDAQVYHYKARAYHPVLGRFLQTDPIGYGDGMNLYSYVGGDPVNFVDPNGLAKGSICWGPADVELPNGRKETKSAGCVSGSVGGFGGSLRSLLFGSGWGLGRGGRGGSDSELQRCTLNDRISAIGQQFGGFGQGVGDALSFGAYGDVWASIPFAGLGEMYEAQQHTVGYQMGMAAGTSVASLRLGYAARAQSFSSMSGREALEARNGLKTQMSGLGAVGRTHPRAKNYDQALSRYGSDRAVAEAASRTNPSLNAAAAVTAGSAAYNYVQCI